MKQKILTFSPLTEKELRKFIKNQPEESAEEIFQRGEICYDNEDYEKAFYWFQKSAEQGHAKAQCCLGYCYNIGQGIEQNYQKAVYWYQKAAEQGQKEAQYNLALCYEDGLGTEKNWITALKWYVQAAEQGYESANKKLESLKK